MSLRAKDWEDIRFGTNRYIEKLEQELQTYKEVIDNIEELLEESMKKNLEYKQKEDKLREYMNNYIAVYEDEAIFITLLRILDGDKKWLKK